VHCRFLEKDQKTTVGSCFIFRDPASIRTLAERGLGFVTGNTRRAFEHAIKAWQRRNLAATNRGAVSNPSRNTSDRDDFKWRARRREHLMDSVDPFAPLSSQSFETPLRANFPSQLQLRVTPPVSQFSTELEPRISHEMVAVLNSIGQIMKSEEEFLRSFHRDRVSASAHLDLSSAILPRSRWIQP